MEPSKTPLCNIPIKEQMLAFMILSLFSVDLISAQCQSTCVRKDVLDYTNQEWYDFSNAFKALSKRNAKGRSPIDNLARDHLVNRVEAHGSAQVRIKSLKIT